MYYEIGDTTECKCGHTIAKFPDGWKHHRRSGESLPYDVQEKLDPERMGRDTIKCLEKGCNCETPKPKEEKKKGE